MPAPEWSLWREYHRRYGFESDRVVWTVANAGAALCRAWGAKVPARRLVAQFEAVPGLSGPALAAHLESLPGARVGRVSGEELKRRQAASRA